MKRLTRISVATLVLAGVLAMTSSNGQAAAPVGNYIITFKSSAASASGTAAVSAAGGSIFRRYSHAINGVAATLPVAAVRGLLNRPEISAVEADAVVAVSGTQSGATWGLDRVDQTALPLNSSYTYNYDGTYNSGSSRVTAYVIDTGILTSHTEFTGRVSTGFSAIKDRYGSSDCNGHGTHVAGTVGGTKYGVAKGVRLVPVRVLDCRGSGTNSGVIAGIDWVISNHAAGVSAVANMSLGGGASAAMDSAVTNLVNDGIVLAVAAGNSNVDACTSSPARAAAAITVGATSSNDARASFSNFGSCLDIFAPGVSITSAWKSSNSSTNSISGTSMASPHVAGVAALVLSAYPTADVATVISKIVLASTVGVVTSPGAGSPNRLLFSLIS